MIKQYLHIKTTKNKGRGVFTKEKIAANTIIEKSPVIVMSREDRKHIDKTLLHDYIFEWGTPKNKICLALGYVSVYNHNYKSNCEYYMNFDEDTIQIKAIRTIEKGEELTINYNGDWNNAKKVWFDVNE